MKGKKKVKEPAGMNIPEIFAALAMLEKERGIPQTFMMDKIIQAVTTAYKRDHKDVENVIVDVDEEHQRLKMYVQKNVVAEEDYVDPFNEIPVEEAKTISAKYEIGDVVVVACAAKISRMTIVRSITFVSSADSRLRSCAGDSSSSQITPVAPISQTISRSSPIFPLPR